jgi:hypothetical protein
MLNPSIIKRGMDDEEYSNACPTIGTLMIAHFSTPERHRKDIYSADGLFFATHPLRRTYLRPAFKNEFDIDERETVNQERPTLWILVSQLVPGRHMILPVWRGRTGLSCLKAAALKVIMDGAHVVERSFSHGINVVYI